LNATRRAFFTGRGLSAATPCAPGAQRQQMAREFEATDIVAERGAEANQAVLDLTGGIGVDAALECVGTS
jgi:threonine dehydrogenase-like Zn-dependent dehydrogenase